MNNIPSKISSHILTIGPDYKNHRGGIGAIIATYSSIFEGFKFVPTFRPYGSNITKSLFFVKQAFVLAKTLSADKEIKIVHIHGSHSGSFFRKLAAFWISKKIFGKKVIYHINASSYDLFYNKAGNTTKKLVKYMMREIDLLICVSPWWKNFYESNFDCKSITIVNNAVGEPDNSVVESKDAQFISLLFLGRVGNRKGIFDLLEVLSEHRDLFEGKIKLFIGGDGEIDRLKEIIEKNKLGNIVEYIGWVDDKKKVSYLKKSDAYILPSYNEGLPVSILEAMSYGLPILSTRVGGTPEVLKTGENGFLFEPGDKQAMYEAINSLLQNRDLLAQYGKSSLIKVEPYLPASVAAQLINCYTPLLVE
jgi:glycosyltransferase involved in cell wall biosynthesis